MGREVHRGVMGEGLVGRSWEGEGYMYTSEENDLHNRSIFGLGLRWRCSLAWLVEGVWQSLWPGGRSLVGSMAGARTGRPG